ncbi:hypothetical protein KKH00_02115, partial [Patescibacteria group bacterium]|nr:hypothetical protein [Patescibacteria group bacterium]
IYIYMSRRTVGIIIVITGLLLIVGIIYVIFFYKFTSQQPEVAIEESSAILEQQKKPVEQSIAVPPTGTIIKVAPIKKTEINQDDLARIASAFAERFGSFSNQSDYENIRDLRLFMSFKMQTWADNYISQAQASHQQTAIYYGITTKAITTEVKQFNSESGQAEILIKNQRKEATGTTVNASTFYQDIIIKFVREKGAWKIDSAIWQAK